MHNSTEFNTKYDLVNIVSGEPKTVLSDIYPDDTNLTVLNKICINNYEDITLNEIYAYCNEYESIGFSYDASVKMGQIMSKNKIDLNDYTDNNFINKQGQKKSIIRNNNLHKLFENNFPIKKNTIYYFSLQELLKEYNGELNDNFLYSIINKYFPNITKKYIDEYPEKKNMDLRKDKYDKTKSLIQNHNHLLKILDDNKKNILSCDTTYKLIKINCSKECDNNINIIKLFSDFKLDDKYLFTKLILNEYQKTFYKLYKPKLKLVLSDDSTILDKDICDKLIVDYKDNINIPLNLNYIPSFAQPKNCFIVKSYLKEHKLFYSFILYKEGKIDLIINNYEYETINLDILNDIINKLNEIINWINKYRVYSINKIPTISEKYAISSPTEGPPLEFLHFNIDFPMNSFMKGQKTIYMPENIINFLSNFYTHIRILKEKQFLHESKDDIFTHYKRVDDYDNVNVIQSIITALNISPSSADEIIQLIHENAGKTIEDATEEYKKWAEINAEEEGQKKYSSLQTKETGSEIIIERVTETLTGYIRFKIYNINSFKELLRIKHFIQIFMYMYSKFVKNKLSGDEKELFTKISNNVKQDNKLQNDNQQYNFIQVAPPTPSAADGDESEPDIISDNIVTVVDSDDEDVSEKPKKISSDKSHKKIPSDQKPPDDILSSLSSNSSSGQNKPPDDILSSLSGNSSSGQDKPPDDILSSLSDKSHKKTPSGQKPPDDILSSLSSDSSSGGGKKNKSTKQDEQLYKTPFKWLNILKNADKKLFHANKDYSNNCMGEWQGNRRPVPLNDNELKNLQKNDILLSATKGGIPIKTKDIVKYMKLPIEDMIEQLKDDKIEYPKDSNNLSVWKSFSPAVDQKKTTDKSVNINYICPKYWDLSRNISIHPRDIEEHLNDIIPPKFKGSTPKHILNREGQFWKKSSDDTLKKELIKKIKPDVIEKEKEKLMKMNLQDFYKNIKKYNISDKNFNEIHQDIVDSFESRFLPDINVDGFGLPCCFNYKGSQKLVKNIKDDDNIYITDKPIAGINKYSHVHPSLQNLFNHADNFYTHKKPLGGFIFKGVIQDNNSILYTLANIDSQYNESIISSDTKDIEKRIKKSHFKQFQNTKKDIQIDIDQIKKKSLTKENLIAYLKQSYIDYIYEVIEPRFNDDDSLFMFMKMGDGNMVQLFKKEGYDLDDIKYFLKYIFDEDSIKKIKNIDIPNKYIVHIKKKCSTHYENIDKKININNFISEFENILNKYDKDNITDKYNIKFLYDLIISKNNYLEYLLSDEKKDYKYIIPLISEIYPNHNYLLFENIDDNINIRLPLNKYNINENITYNFIYKKGDNYQPIYYLNAINQINSNKFTCDFIENISDNSDINNYINKIINGIRDCIDANYTIKYGQLNIFNLNTCLDELIELDFTPKYLLVDNYCKISHVITEDKKDNYIIPVIPTNIIKEYKSYKFKLIYNFKEKENDKSKMKSLNIPSLSTYLLFTRKLTQKKGHKKNIYEKYFNISGLIVDKNNDIINIVFENDTYIPIKPVQYDKNDRKIKKYPIVGDTNIYDLDKYIQRFVIEKDKRVDYNININYIKYITNLTIQNIIFYLKSKYKPYEFISEEHGVYTIGDTYKFKIIQKTIDDKTFNFIEKNTDFIDESQEPNKIKGTVTDIKPPVGDKSKIMIDISYLDIMYLISNNEILINHDKHNFLYEIINQFINDIVIKLSDKDFEKNKLKEDLSICFENEEDSCKYPCNYDSDKCKLYVKESAFYDSKSLIDKIIWKFVELFLIHKDIDIINNILQDNIYISDLYKYVGPDEIFFNHSQYLNDFLDDIFKYKSKFIRDINFYDKDNDTPVTLNKPKNISSILNGIPNIIKQLFKGESNVLIYIDEENIDFSSLEKSLNEISGGSDDYTKIKHIIISYINKDSKLHSKIQKGYNLYDSKFKLPDFLKNKIINDNTYKISPYDLEILCKCGEYDNIGFLLITSKYTKQESSKLKHNIIFKYGELNKDTKFILLYHFKNKKDYDLANIIVKNGHDDEASTYDTFMTLDKLYEIKQLKTIIDNDYPDIKELFKKK